jgi:cell division protein FtsQ
LSRRVTRARAAHGAGFAAPSEFGFVTTESPLPRPVADRREASDDSPTPRSVGAVLVSALKLSVGLALVGSISLAIAWGAHRYALTTPRFAVRDIDVRGNRHHSGEELSRIAGLERGKNLFSVDTAEAERRLLENPWVRQARVGRTLPSTLRIDVSERQAVAATTLEDALYLVTPEGEPFKAIEAGDPADLPVITGIGPRDLAVDRARAIDRLAAAIEVLREYEAIPMSRVYEAEEVHLVADGSVVFTIGKRGTTLYLGKGPFRQKLLMAARVIGKLQTTGELPGIIFLDNEAHPERVVVRMR